MGAWKQDLKNIIDALPEDTALEEAVYQLYARQKIAMGIKDGEEGRIIANDEILKKYHLK